MRINYRKNRLVCPSRDPARASMEPPIIICLQTFINYWFETTSNKLSIIDVELLFNEWLDGPRF